MKIEVLCYFIVPERDITREYRMNEFLKDLVMILQHETFTQNLRKMFLKSKFC